MKGSHYEMENLFTNARSIFSFSYIDCIQRERKKNSRP